MKRDYYHNHAGKQLELRRLEPEITAPQPDRYFCRECGIFYIEVFGDASGSGLHLQQYAFSVKPTDGTS